MAERIIGFYYNLRSVRLIRDSTWYIVNWVTPKQNISKYYRRTHAFSVQKKNGRLPKIPGIFVLRWRCKVQFKANKNIGTKQAAGDISFYSIFVRENTYTTHAHYFYKKKNGELWQFELNAILKFNLCVLCNVHEIQFYLAESPTLVTLL